MTEVRKHEVVERIKQWIVERLPVSSETTSPNDAGITASASKCANIDGAVETPILDEQPFAGAQTQPQSEVAEHAIIHVDEGPKIPEGNNDLSMETKSMSWGVCVCSCRFWNMEFPKI